MSHSDLAFSNSRSCTFSLHPNLYHCPFTVLRPQVKSLITASITRPQFHGNCGVHRPRRASGVLLLRGLGQLDTPALVFFCRIPHSYFVFVFDFLNGPRSSTTKHLNRGPIVALHGRGPRPQRHSWLIFCTMLHSSCLLMSEDQGNSGQPVHECAATLSHLFPMPLYTFSHIAVALQTADSSRAPEEVPWKTMSQRS